MNMRSDSEAKAAPQRGPEDGRAVSNDASSLLSATLSEQERRSLERQFRRDYFTVAMIPVVLMFLVVMIVSWAVGNDTQSLMSRLVEDLGVSAREALERSGKEFIIEKANSTAKAVEIYLRDHIYVTMQELQTRPAFTEIALQYFGETGYTALHEAETNIVRLHPNAALVNRDVSYLADELPEWWRIFNVSDEIPAEGREDSSIMADTPTTAGAVSEGYYMWVDEDGSRIRKYMAVVPVGLEFHGTTLVVAATIDAREFYVGALAEMFGSVDEILNDALNAVRRGQIAFAIIGVLSIGMVFVIVRTQARRAVRRYISPVRLLADAAASLGEGQWRDAAFMELLSRRDEIGRLAQSFVGADTKIRELLANLEQTVQDRTQGLRVAAEISQATTVMEDPDTLMAQAVNLVRDRFSLYYVGVFLMDKSERWIVLRAGTGEAGRQMLEAGHKFEIDSDSMIATCVRAEQAQVPQDIREAEARFVNPLLPKTQSEIALPLRARGQVIGAMTVQSDVANAFDEADIAVFQTVADELAVAIENARLYNESQAALAAMRRAYGEFTQETWYDFLQQQEALGYQADAQGTFSLDQVVLDKGGMDLAADAASERPYEIPISVRGRVIGMLEAFKPRSDSGDGMNWTDEDVRQLKTLAVQLGVALDSALQFEMTQRRAERERMVSEISTRLAQTMDIETMLRMAVQELGQLPGVVEASVHLADNLGGSDAAVKDGA
jgi:GAF domain-containing protein